MNVFSFSGFCLLAFFSGVICALSGGGGICGPNPSWEAFFFCLITGVAASGSAALLYPKFYFGGAMAFSLPALLGLDVSIISWEWRGLLMIIVCLASVIGSTWAIRRWFHERPRKF